MIEDSTAASCSPASGGIPRQEFNQSIIRSPTPLQAAGNAHVMAVQAPGWITFGAEYIKAKLKKEEFGLDTKVA